MTFAARRLPVSLIFAVSLASSAISQDAPQPNLSVSLNSLEDRDNGCRMTFVVRNATAQEITQFGVEIAIFREGGALDRLMRLNLGQMLEGKTRVRQFDVDGTSCETIDNVLVNDVTQCTGGDLTPLACMRALEATSASNVGLGL